MRPIRMIVLLLALVTSHAVAQYPGSASAPTLRKALPCGPERHCQGTAQPTLTIRVPDSARVADTIVPILRIVNLGSLATQPMAIRVTFNNHFADEDSVHARRTVPIPAIAPGDTLDVPVRLVTDTTPWNANIRDQGRVHADFMSTSIVSDPIFCRIPISKQP